MTAPLTVLIAGGGMVGCSLALCLHHQLGERARVLLVESFPLPAQADFASAYSPSFDARSTALSYASQLIFAELGLWQTLAAQACPIENIHVSERGRFGSTLMRAADYDWPALGYVLENAWLGNCLVQALHERGIDTLSPARVTRAERQGELTRVELDDGQALEAQLLVVADGAGSALRDSLGIEVEQQAYGQHALIANVAHKLPHHGCAYERFTDTGPLAMLPLTAEAGAPHRSALVWSLSPAQAAELEQASEQDCLAELQRCFGYRLGRLERLGERHSYPLALVEAREQVRSGIVVMGNAAHSLHPVAGQGFNLSLRDVACLGVALREARDAGVGAGDLSVLQCYSDRQARDQAFTTRFSDQLPGLFMHRDPALGLARDLGLLALDLSPGLKREFVRQTAGLSASAEYRDVRP